MKNYKSKYSMTRTSAGWDLSWWDGRGTYITYEDLPWYLIPYGLIRLWWEVHFG